MSTQAPAATAQKPRSRKWWPVIGVMLGLVAGAIGFRFAKPVYQASTSVAIVSQRVPETMVHGTVTAPLSERLDLITQQVLSRTRLERIIREFNLYEEEQQQMVMEDVIEQMRSDTLIDVNAPKDDRASPSFTVSFRSPDPRTAMRVTERLASLMVQENLEDRELMADQTKQFLQRQAEEAQRRLMESQAKLEAWARQAAGRTPPQELVAQNDVLQETYRSILRNTQDAEMAVNLERHQIGEQFRIIDGARMPEKPSGPARLPFLAWGALGGLATSLLLMPLSSKWRRRTVASPA